MLRHISLVLSLLHCPELSGKTTKDSETSLTGFVLSEVTLGPLNTNHPLKIIHFQLSPGITIKLTDLSITLPLFFSFLKTTITFACLQASSTSPSLHIDENKNTIKSSLEVSFASTPSTPRNVICPDWRLELG